MLMPNILVIGAAKSGTTSLHRYLDQHPDVFMTGRKEPRFFAYENEEMNYRGPSAAGRPDLNAEAIEHEKYSHSVTNLRCYRELFRHAGDTIAQGESSTAYLYVPKAIERIRHYCPKAKLIAVLRHPADRAYSKFSQMRRDHAEPLGTFREAIAAEPSRIEMGWAPAWHYKQRGYYYKQLSNIFRNFESTQIRIVTFDNFIRDTSSVMKNIYGFIGVDDSFAPDVSYRYNVSSDEFNNDKRQEFDSDSRAALIEEYRNDIHRLGDMIDTDLSHWL